MLFLLAFRSVRQLGGVRVVLLMLLCVVVALAVAGVVLAVAPQQTIEDCAAIDQLPDQIPFEECAVLLDIYTQMEGETWKNTIDGYFPWFATNTPCPVTGDPDAGWYGVTCALIDGGLHVTGIQLTGEYPILGGALGNNVIGPIPATIGNLAYLSDFNLSFNNLSALAPVEIPTEIGHLADSLTSLSLVNCGLTGEIPAEIGLLVKLTALDLHGSNHFTGGFPDELNNLENLTYLHLGQWGVQFTDTLPELGGLTKLETLYIHTLPRVSGRIPDSYANLTALKALNLSGNNLNGPFPGWLDELPNLVELYLNGNSLTGPYPSVFSSDKLVGLSISPTDVTHEVPSWVASLDRLEVLALMVGGFGGFTGKLPQEIIERDYRVVNFSGNHFSDQLPSSFWDNPNLEQLTFYDDTLRVTVPNDMNLPALVAVDMWGQHFGGNAAAFAESTNLGQLYLRHGQFGGGIDWVTGLDNLYYLLLSYNRFSGSIPDDFIEASLPNLRYLNLDYNLLTPPANPQAALMVNTLTPGWQATQTVPPDNVTVAEAHATGATLTWDAPDYVADAGFYQITATPRSTFHSGCPAEVVVETPLFAGKGVEEFTVTNLCPKTIYDFEVQTITLPNTNNPNRLESGPSNMAEDDTVITSVVLVATSLDHPTMTLKFDSLMQTLQTAVAANPNSLYVVLTDQYGEGNTAIYVLAGDEPLKINGLPNPVTSQLDPTLTEYDMSNSGVLTEGAAGNDLGAFIRWARITYAPTLDIPYSFSFIGHGIPLAPAAPNLFCYFPIATRPNGQDACDEPDRLPAWTYDDPWIFPPLPSQQDINPDWTDATSQGLISPYTLAQALEMGTTGGLRPLSILDIVHCFAGTVEEFYEVSRSPTTGAPLAHVIIGSPNYTYFGPELALEALLAVDFTQDPATTATGITAAYNAVLNSADLFDGDSGADDIVNGTDDVEHPRVITALDNRSGQLSSIKTSVDVLAGLLYDRLYDVDTYQDTFEAIRRASEQAGHYDTTLCEPQDWQLNAQDGLADLYSLMRQLEVEFAADSEVATAALNVTESLDAAIIAGALRQVDGTPWFADPPSLWSFSDDARGLAIYADFLGRPDGGEVNRLLGWQAYWYTALPFGSSLPHHSNPHPLAFNARPEGGHSWADVAQAFWERYGGEVKARACTATLPEIRPRAMYVPLAVAPFNLPVVAR